MRSPRLLIFSFISSVVATALKVLALLMLRRASHLTHAKIRSVLGKSCLSLSWEPYELALIHAEDHRFHLHHGVDYIALTRALYQTFLQSCRQGGSTIEQQLVRTLNGDYRRSYRRKLRELLIASTLASNFSKQEVLKAYLSVAYFGTGVVGLTQAIKEICIPENVTEHGAAYLIAHLRFPLPKCAEDFSYPRRFRRMLVTAHYCGTQASPLHKLTRYRSRKLLALGIAENSFFVVKNR